MCIFIQSNVVATLSLIVIQFVWPENTKFILVQLKDQDGGLEEKGHWSGVTSPKPLQSTPVRKAFNKKRYYYRKDQDGDLGNILFYVNIHGL